VQQEAGLAEPDAVHRERAADRVHGDHREAAEHAQGVDLANPLCFVGRAAAAGAVDPPAGNPAAADPAERDSTAAAPAAGADDRSVRAADEPLAVGAPSSTVAEGSGSRPTWLSVPPYITPLCMMYHCP